MKNHPFSCSTREKWRSTAPWDKFWWSISATTASLLPTMISQVIQSIDQSIKQLFICLKLNKKQLKIHVCTVIRGSAIAEKAPWIQLQLSPLPVRQKVFISSKSSFFTAFA